MIASLSFEWLKLSKRMMPRIILGMLVGITVVGFWGQATRVDAQPNLFLPRGWLTTLSFCAFFAPFFWPVLGGSWAGNEYGWGTIRTILTRRPYRIQQVLSALAVLALSLGVALLILLGVGTLAGIAVSLATGHDVFYRSVWDTSFFGLVAKGFLTAWFVSTFYLLVAYAGSVVFRSAAVGIGLGIGSTLAEIVLAEIFGSLGGVWKDIADHFPFVYSRDLITEVVHGGLAAGTRFSQVDPTSPNAGLSLFALTVYAAAVIAITVVAVRVRDVTA